MKKAFLSILIMSGFLLFCGSFALAGNVWYTLWAAQNVIAGDVHVYTSGTNLRIDFIPLFDWELAEYHVAVATTFDGIPQTNNGNPIPGQFTWHDAFITPISTNYPVTIPLSMINGGVSVGQTVYVAIHVVMVQRDAYGNIIRNETGWAGPCDGYWSPGNPLPSPFDYFDKGWGFYFTFVI